MHSALVVISKDRGLVEELRRATSDRYEVIAFDSLEGGTVPVRAESCPALVAHISRNMINGHRPHEFFRRLRELESAAPIFAVLDEECSAEIREKAVENVQAFLQRPFQTEKLLSLIRTHSPLEYELAEYLRRHPHRILRGKSRSYATFSPRMFDMMDELGVAAQHDVTILLSGETGSGKSSLARVIHDMSGRSAGRCLTVACGALPPNLIESELFGHVKGAFTGADNERLGKFAAAQDGTLLLDEIDVLPPDQQAKLLRVIETGEYEPVGSNDTRISTARLIAATNTDLEQLVREGKFRRDLYYRLNILSFHLPPLRERPHDVEYLALRFALQHAKALKVPIQSIDPRFTAALTSHAWPGNVRELENVMRRAVLYCRDGALRPCDLPSTIRGTMEDEPFLPADRDLPSGGTLAEQLEAAERRILVETLRRNGYHRQDTARELGISRITLYHKMRKYGLFECMAETA
ncbi:MAG: sigma-54 interaction domain-containing protein [Thermogutta sp.]